jgi:Tfp pilus assembly protein PilO
MIGGGALVIIMLLWAMLVSPENAKLASLQAQQTTLQGQQATLEAKLASLKSETQRLPGNCADLEKIVTQIPSVQTPTDLDAEESSFEQQFNDLARTSGVTLNSFSGFANTDGAGGAAAPVTATPTAGATGTSSTAGVTPVPTTLEVTGNYGQVMSYIQGLDSFPRLFVINHFTLALGGGVVTTSSSGSGTSGSGSSGGTTPLWVGGKTTPNSAGPYTLTIVGSIFYTSTPNPLAACERATAVITKK